MNAPGAVALGNLQDLTNSPDTFENILDTNLSNVVNVIAVFRGVTTCPFTPNATRNKGRMF